MGLIDLAVQDGVALITLDDPGRRNAVSLVMADELVAALAEVGGADDVHAVVVTGTPPAFSAGADLADLEGADRARLARIYAGFMAVAECPLPTIAAVNGAAVGAGLNLALACDLRVAAASARFESRFLDLALHPGGGHTWMLQRLLGPQGATAMVVLGEPLDGAAAVARGLAWTCVDDDRVVDEALRLAARAARAPRATVVSFKATLRAMATVTGHRAALELELGPQHDSLHQDAFRDRLAALRERIARRRS